MEYSTPPRYNHIKLSAQKGFLLLEAVISMALFAVLIIFFIASFQYVFLSQKTSGERVQASLYAQEAMEISYNLANTTADWPAFVASFAPATAYHPEIVPMTQLVVGEEVLDEKYTRQVFVQTVERNPVAHIIVPNGTPGAVVDSDTLQLTTLVTWEVGGTIQEVRYEMFVIKK